MKLRGFRVELGEIEAALLRDRRVRAAACALRENARGEARLVGYVVPRNGDLPDPDELRSALRAWLPAWMVPSLIESLGDLPRLPSGKLDRAALPEPRVRPQPRGTPPAHPESASACKLKEVWDALFRPLEVSLDDDFFLDLGGHSLLAARMVSELRMGPGFASLTVGDVYRHPTISRLSAAIDGRVARPAAAPAAASQKPRRRGAHFAAGVIQSASLYFIFAFRGVQWVTPFLIYWLLIRHKPALESALWGLAGAIAVLPVLILTAILAKWVLLGRVRAGRYPLWGAYYVRWWFVQTLLQTLPLTLLGGTPLLPLVYRGFGARIGKDVQIATSLLAAFDLISIGEGASVDEGASLIGHTVENGELVIGPVSVGRHCLVGTRSVLCPGTALEDHARLEDLSLLPSGTRIPSGETWTGSPAGLLSKNASTEGNRPVRSPFHRAAITLLYAAVVLAFPLVELSAFLPGMAILMRLDPAHGAFYLAAPLVGLSFIVGVTAEVALLKWLVLGRARAGKYPVHGWFYIRHWVVEQLLALSLEVAGPLHATLFLKSWYRALGAKLGRYVELSTAITTTPDLLWIEDDSFVADDVSLGAARVEGGWLTLAPTRLGRRSFVGNGAVVPAGATLGAGSLLGVLTLAPGDPAQSARAGACWLGSPPVFLPRRQLGADFPEQATYRPTRRIEWARGCWELLRVALPGAGFIVAAVGVIEAALRLWDPLGPAATLLLLPAIFAACCLGVMLTVVPINGSWWAATGLCSALLECFRVALGTRQRALRVHGHAHRPRSAAGHAAACLVSAPARLPHRTRGLYRFHRFY